jgi:hypothetical protein
MRVCRRMSSITTSGSTSISPDTAPIISTQFAVAPSILSRSYRITAGIEVPQGGAIDVLVTWEGRFAGCALYTKSGRPTFAMNLIGLERPKWQSSDALPPGKTHCRVRLEDGLHRAYPSRAAAPASCRSTGNRSRSGRLPRPCRSSGHGTRPSKSASIPARR